MKMLSNDFESTTGVYNVRNVHLMHILTLHLECLFDENRRSLKYIHQVHWVFVIPYSCTMNYYSVGEAGHSSDTS